jgi:hypothetical protein
MTSGQCNLFRVLWHLADEAREAGKRDEASILYRRAFSAVGLSLEDILMIEKSATTEALQRPSVSRKCRSPLVQS